MKALNIMTGSEKARLLHELFPAEIEDLLRYIAEYCAHFESKAEDYKKSWTNGFMAFDYWFSLSRETAVLVNRNQQAMIRSSKIFSDQLYFGYTSLFVTDCIIKYAENVSTNEKLNLLIQVLFV